MRPCRDRMNLEYILHNNEFVIKSDAILTAENRGLRYGDGLFESMRMQRGQLMFAELHADRLAAGMRALQINGSNLMDAWFLKKKAGELFRKNKLGNHGRFRLSIYRAGGGFYQPEKNEYGYILEGVPAEPGYAINSKGLIIDVYDEIPKPLNSLSNYKTSNALIYVMAGIFKAKHRLDEAILLNQNGFLCEAISSNIFIVYDKQIYTPSLAEGCIAGVMRSVILRIAMEQNIPINEAQISPQILNEADEIFLTNASGGIKWVMGFGRRRYFNEISRMLSVKLNSL